MESRKLDGDVNDLVKHRGRWRPEKSGAVACKTPQKQGAVRLAGVCKDEENSMFFAAKPNSRTLELQGTPTQLKIASPGSSVTSTANKGERSSHEMPPGSGPHDPQPELRSPVAGKSPAKVELHLVLLHSQIINLQIRHQTLSSTSLTRTGSLLDMIIDNATFLKDLGGTDGPSVATDICGSVIPNELLEQQERLEAELLNIGARITWCKQLEVQWDRQVFLAILQVS